ncbi:hypothetical protein OG500_28205 [Kitasatospora sp. NBC_01250]|uniref:hypothetical protein n=1 Tax=unclassified Kitasatospora TaxID=2633591 RepID=UPI002E10AE59|nr:MULTISPECIES: hypothetical protein [unclassified Kitasatospora]WSJ69970.1 hypothetical protein OG294_29865 [Kitasatospora sp. NBC_01302]
MVALHRGVLLRAVAAALVLAAAFGGEHAVGHALAKRGAELAARQNGTSGAPQSPGGIAKRDR